MEENTTISDTSQIGALRIPVNLIIKCVESLDRPLLIAGAGLIKNSTIPHHPLTLTTKHLCLQWLLLLALPLTLAGTLILVQPITVRLM